MQGTDERLKFRSGQTVRIGFAFLSICAFWQLYNTVIPLILTNTFHINETFSGVIMAMDNILGIFLLPFFGSLSDKTKTAIGRRKPYILFGTISAVILMLLIPVLDDRYAASPSRSTLIAFIALLGVLLLVMGVYRSPAVALMPDCTPKSLRSQGNAVINLMGAIGGIIYLIISSVLYSKSRTEGPSHVDYGLIFVIVAVIMVLSLLIIMLTVDEIRLSKEAEEIEQLFEEKLLNPENTNAISDNSSGSIASSDKAKAGSAVPDDNAVNDNSGSVRKSLVFLLVSVSLWFISYNGIETWFTTYANHMWNMSLGQANLCLTIATAGAIVSYIPIGNLAARFGRKTVINFGILDMTGCFLFCFVYTYLVGSFSPVLFALFVLIGVGWASINVNSLPMVVEMCSEQDIGKFTGYYYTFSMAAQIATPIAAGFLMNRLGYNTLFPYCTIFMFAAYITMKMVRHGDVKKG